MRQDQQQNGPLEPQDIEELLPWYVTGRVSREEARGIEAALKTMPDLPDKLALAQRERDAVARAAETIEPPPPETLQNLLQQVETTRQLRPGRADTAGQPGGWLADAFNRNLVWQGAFAVASIAIVVLGVRLYTLPSSDFGVAGDAPATSINGAANPTLLVTFQPDATVSQITALLTELDAVVADGPKPGGAYVIHLPRADDVAAAMSTLESRKDLVASVLRGL